MVVKYNIYTNYDAKIIVYVLLIDVNVLHPGDIIVNYKD